MRINRKLYVVDDMYVTTTESNITIFARDMKLAIVSLG